MGLIETLITSLVPLLLKEAESLLGVQANPGDNSWVSGLIKEIVGLIQKFIPSWLAPTVEEIEQLVAAEVEKLVSKI